MPITEEEDGIVPDVVNGSALMALESAEIDRQIATAKRWPRPEPQKIIKNMRAYALLDEETASGCFYVLKRKKRNDDGTMEDVFIDGPSVRLAEIAFGCFQNLRAGNRIIGNDGKKITAQGACLDLENNVAASTTVERSILTSKGKTYGNDMQVTTANAGQAIAFRNAIFKVIPLSMIRPVFLACKAMAAGQGPIEARFQTAVKMFKPWGITSQMLLAWIKKEKAEDLVDDDIVSLRGLFTSFKDGETTIQGEFGDINPDGTRKTTADSSAPPSEASKAKAEAMKDQPNPTPPGESMQEQPEPTQSTEEPQQTTFTGATTGGSGSGPTPINNPSGRRPVRPHSGNQ